MKKIKVIGITGGIGGGKSTFANILQSKGYAVYDSDLRARLLQNENPEIKQKISELFGEEVYNADGLNSKLLAYRVFGSPDLLQQLNKIVHPAVFQDFTAWIDRHQQDELLFVESALLFSSDLHHYTDFNIVITAPEDVRIQRVMQRDNLTAEQASIRISSQLPEETNIAKADLTVYSDGKTNITEETVNKVLKNLQF